MNDFTKGALEGLGYCLTLLPKRAKASQTISERIVEITRHAPCDLDFRTKAMG